MKSKEIPVPAFIEEIAEFLSLSVSTLKLIEENIAMMLKRDLPDIEIKVYQKLQILVKNAMQP